MVEPPSLAAHEVSARRAMPPMAAALIEAVVFFTVSGVRSLFAYRIRGGRLPTDSRYGCEVTCCSRKGERQVNFGEQVVPVRCQLFAEHLHKFAADPWARAF